MDWRHPFGRDHAQPATSAAPAEIPEAAPAVTGPGDDGGRFADWVRRPDTHGRMGWEAPSLPETVPLDALPRPAPTCPVCGSLESWEDALGRQRCGVCEAATLGRALKLADKAAELRKRRSCQNENPRTISTGIRR
jgi:hypothetical protein